MKVNTLLFMLILCSPRVTFSQTLQEVWLAAKRQSPEIEVANSRVAIAKSRVDQSARNLLPNLTGSLGKTMNRWEDAPQAVNREPRLSTEARLRLTQNILDFSSYSAKNKSSLEFEVAIQEQVSTEELLRINLSQAYLNFHFGYLRTRLFMDIFPNILQVQNNINALEQAGQLDRTSGNFLLARISRLNGTRRMIDEDVQQSKLFLENTTQLALQETCKKELSKLPLPDASLAAKEKPEQKLYELKVKIADEELRQRRFARLPSFQLFLDKSWRNDDQTGDGRPGKQARFWSAGVELTWSFRDQLTLSDQIHELELRKSIVKTEATAFKDSQQRTLLTLARNLADLSRQDEESRAIQQRAIDMLRSIDSQSALGHETRINKISSSISALEILLNALEDQLRYRLAYVQYLQEAGHFDEAALKKLSDSLCAVAGT
jgi:outer membrane protein TolC